MSSSAQRPSTATVATLTAVRMLIASYFVASAGLIHNAAGASFLEPILSAHVADGVATAVYYITAFAIMAGWMVREAALILALFVAWSSLGLNLFAPGPSHLAELWQDMSLVGAILLIGLVQPGGSRSLRLVLNRSVRPRRIAMPQAAAVRSARPNPLWIHAAAPEEGPDDANIFNDLRTG